MDFKFSELGEVIRCYLNAASAQVAGAANL